MKNIKLEALEKMFDEINNDQSSNKYKKPVVAVLYDSKNNEIIDSQHNIYPTKECVTNCEKAEFHAETIMAKRIAENRDKDLSLIVTIPPCKCCYKNMMELTNVNEIFFLTRLHQDHKWGERIKYKKRFKLRDVPYKRIKSNGDTSVRNIISQNRSYIREVEKFCKKI